MKWVVMVVGGLVVLIVIVALVGALLPREHVATSTVTIREPPEAVWAVVRDLGRVGAWWPAITRAERLPDRDGHEVWRHVMKQGFAMPLVVIEARAPQGWIANPVFRFMSRAVFGYYRTLDGYLTQLGRKFGQDVTPTHS